MKSCWILGRSRASFTPWIAGCCSAPAMVGASESSCGGRRCSRACATLTLAYSWLTVYVARAVCTCGSWIVWLVARFQAALSSICRLTQVVRIATRARTVPRTTSVQITIRRLRVSGAAAFAVGTATSLSVPPPPAERHRPIRVIRRDANDPNGFDLREPDDDILHSDGHHPRISPVPCGLRA